MVDAADLDRAVAALGAGALVVFPTETVYGLGCDALDPTALERLCAAKQRPAEKGIAVILGGEEMLAQITEAAGDVAVRLARAFWPGPLTLLVPARPGLPAPVVRDGRIGCRISSDPIARHLASALGRPIAAPSANPADFPPAHDLATARRYFGGAVAVYLDGGDRHGTPSTLVDPGPPLRILRPGPVDAADIEHALL